MLCARYTCFKMINTPLNDTCTSITIIIINIIYIMTFIIIIIIDIHIIILFLFLIVSTHSKTFLCVLKFSLCADKPKDPVEFNLCPARVQVSLRQRSAY